MSLIKKDKATLKDAVGILYREGFMGTYDGTQSAVLWEASHCIEKAILLIELAHEQLEKIRQRANARMVKK